MTSAARAATASRRCASTTRPISTLTRDITFVSDVPMELGCHYGGRYWKNKAKAESLQACLELSEPGV